MREAVIVSSVRTAVGKAPKGSLSRVRPDDFAAAAIQAAWKRVPALRPEMIDDVILGCAMPEAEQGMNVARLAALLAGIPQTAGGMTINRFCSSGLNAIAIAANSIRAGEADVVVAGGTESMSMIPMGGNKIAPNPTLVERYPDAYLGMGMTAELVATKYQIPREACDEFALASHMKALAAIAAGKFKDEILPLDIGVGKDGKTIVFDTDEGPRKDTNLEALAKLRPVFSVKGVTTAGNSSQMSDGAAATIVMSLDRAKQLGLTPIARFVTYAVAGVPPEIMGTGPIEAVPRALKQAGLKLADIDVIELNEAFASQSLAVIRTLGLDPTKVNVNGGAIALGHPLGCTGAKLTATILGEMKRRNARYGLVTMCVGGGMGAAGIFERM
jgi:acetyl-CoA acyltransferase